MVHSFTALRTLVQAKYGLTGHKTEDGLLVPKLSLTDVAEEHKLCYSCEQIGTNGVLFKLSGAMPKVRTLPITKDNFLLRCVRSPNIELIEQKTLQNTSIELTANNDPIIRMPNAGYGCFSVVTIRLKCSPQAAQKLLSKCSYEQSTKDEQLYRVYFRIGGYRKSAEWDRQDVATLLEIVCKEEGEWRGFKWQEVKELVKQGSVEVLFNQELKSSLEEGVWD